MKKLGFIGAGNMAEAIARAAIAQGVLRPEEMIAADPTAARRDLFASLGIACVGSNEHVAQGSEQVMLSVKPQAMADVMASLRPHLREDHVVVSIMAGIGSAKIAEAAGGPLRVVRVMPNTPLMVGLGMAGVCTGGAARPGDEALAMRLFGAGGSKAIAVSEAELDAITAVSGSGPAYVFYLAEAMQRAATELGLREHARLLVNQTILGAAKLLAESPDSAAELRRKVTSPGGTTEAAIKHMDGNKTVEVVVNALKAAQKRSRELGA